MHLWRHRVRYGALGLATVLSAVGPGAVPPVAAQSRSGPCDSAELSVTSLGTAINEGVGYGGVRIGDPEATLKARWGLSLCQGRSGEELHVYGALREADQAAELVVVRVEGGRVAVMAFFLAPHAGIDRAIGFTTLAGIRAGMSVQDALRAYGRPDATMDRLMLYASRGVGFPLYRGQILGIAIFAPGTTPNLDGLLY